MERFRKCFHECSMNVSLYGTTDAKKEHNLKSVGLQQYNKALIEQIYIYYI